MPETNPIRPFLGRGALIVDGGLATELEARGADLADGLWSARLLRDAPEQILQVHLDYLEAGADCIVSASYQASVPGLRAAGATKSEAVALVKSAVRLARQARDAFWRRPESRPGRLRPLVAASVGPYGAFLADGSEYSGAYDLGEAALVDFHRRRWGLLASAGPDLLACETIPSAIETRAFVALLEHSDLPAWFSFCCRDGHHLADGSPVAESAAAAAEHPRTLAVGVNCTAPRFVESLITDIRRVTDKPIVVYPNSGERYDTTTRGWLPAAFDQPALAEGASRWLAAGARLIGGCCRTRPGDIRALRRAVMAAPPAPAAG